MTAVSIKSQVNGLLDVNPFMSISIICKRLDLPYDQHKLYVSKLICQHNNGNNGNGNSVKTVSAPKLKRVVKRSCRNCGWKLGKTPIVVELYGFERVDRKAMVKKNKWCVIWAERPTKCPCSEWTKKT